MPTPTAPTATATTRTPRRASRAALARCLEPIDAETFLVDYWEQRPLVVPRDEPGRFDHLLSEADVERLVCSTAIRYPAFRLVREGSQIAVGAYASDVSWRPPFTGTADVPRVLEEWEAGATIVLQALHVNWHPLAVFCRLLEGALGRAVQVNAYYTPRGSQGFGVHHDTHDVLVVQVAGEKRWKLYDPLLELPLKHQRYSAALGEHGARTDDLVLRAGDTLYLPRGWLHEAETSRPTRCTSPSGSRPTPGSTRRGTRSRRARTNQRSAAMSRAATARASRRGSPKSSGPTWSSIGGGGGSSTRVARSGRTASRSSARSSGLTSTRFSSDARP